MNRRSFLAAAVLPLLPVVAGRRMTVRISGYRLGSPLFRFGSVSVHLMCHEDPREPLESSYRESVVALASLTGDAFPGLESMMDLSDDYFSDLEALGFSAWIRYPTHVTAYDRWELRTRRRKSAIEHMATHMERVGWTTTAQDIRVQSDKFFIRPEGA